MCGQAGIAVSEAMELSPREFHYYLNGKFNADEMNYKTLWEIARFSTTYVAAPNWDSKKHGKLSPQKLIRFPWEKVTKSNPISLEEFKRIDKAWQVSQQ